MSKFVWDASALLLLLNREKGWQEISPLLGEATITSVNLCEVGSKMVSVGVPAPDVEPTLSALPLRVVSADRDLGYRAARLVEVTREQGLSLGDRICLACGLRARLPILTADRAWRKLKLEVEIHLVR